MVYCGGPEETLSQYEHICGKFAGRKEMLLAGNFYRFHPTVLRNL